MSRRTRRSTPITLGIDIGGTFIKAGLVRGKKILSQETLPTRPFNASPKRLIGALVDLTAQMRRQCAEPVRGLGIGIPGLIRYPAGVVRTCVNLSGWKDVPLRSILKRKLKMPVQVDNDVNVMTLAEWRYGAGRGVSNLICLTLGTGVGGGLVLGGALFRSEGGPTGEIGHLPLQMEGPRCPCGGRGCLERYVGNQAILRSVRRQLRQGRPSRILKLVDDQIDRVTPEIIDEACRLGDRFAREVWRQAGARIGLVLVQAVNLLNPQRIVIGGGISKAGRWIFSPIRQTVKERVMSPLRNVPVVSADLGNAAGVIGAALLVRDES